MFGITFILSFVAFVAFPESTDAILETENKENVNVETSGSLGLYKDGKCQNTYGNMTIISDEFNEWCSNIAIDKDPKNSPWIQYSLKGKVMKVKKYSIRNGCCRYFSCCMEQDGKIIDYRCCCELYSYSLHGSNDNKTWKVLHRVEKDTTFDYCGSKTYELPNPTTAYRYYRFVLDQEWPGCPKCMQINQIELYGQTMQSLDYTDEVSNEEDETISIIGRVKKNE